MAILMALDDLTPVDGDMQSPAGLLNTHIYWSNLHVVEMHCGSDQYKEKLVAKLAKAKDY